MKGCLRLDLGSVVRSSTNLPPPRSSPERPTEKCRRCAAALREVAHQLRSDGSRAPCFRGTLSPSPGDEASTLVKVHMEYRWPTEAPWMKPAGRKNCH